MHAPRLEPPSAPDETVRAVQPKHALQVVSADGRGPMRKGFVNAWNISCRQACLGLPILDLSYTDNLVLFARLWSTRGIYLNSSDNYKLCPNKKENARHYIRHRLLVFLFFFLSPSYAR